MLALRGNGSVLRRSRIVTVLVPQASASPSGDLTGGSGTPGPTPTVEPSPTTRPSASSRQCLADTPPPRWRPCRARRRPRYGANEGLHAGLDAQTVDPWVDPCGPRPVSPHGWGMEAWVGVMEACPPTGRRGRGRGRPVGPSATRGRTVIGTVGACEAPDASCSAHALRRPASTMPLRASAPGRRSAGAVGVRGAAEALPRTLPESDRVGRATLGTLRYARSGNRDRRCSTLTTRAPPPLATPPPV